MNPNMTPVAQSSPSPTTPESILVVGAGVFGLSTTLSLLLSPHYTSTRITLLDTHAPIDGLDSSDSFNPHAASIDTSRIIRADYANPLYSRLAEQAQQHWRTDFTRDGIYHESGLAIVAERGQSGWEYIEKSRQNVGCKAGEEVRGLDSVEEIKKALKTGGSTGSAGYINYRSGWADASAAMAEMRRRVDEAARQQGRKLWKRGKAIELLCAEPKPSTKRRKITGIRLSSGETLTASLTILATGAWTGSLLDLRGRAEASAQVLAYIAITPHERAQLQEMPVVLNLSSGLFAMPPSSSSPNSTFKIARHGYGYRNPVRVTSSPRTISLPSAHFTPIPSEGAHACRQLAQDLLPAFADRDFCATRLCWYTDTPRGDFIIDYPAESEGLFLATGGSGHAFKFLPVIGEKIVQAVEGRLEREYRDLWKWPEQTVEGFRGTEDGSRGGRRGMLLDEEWGKGWERGGSKL